MMLTAIAGVFFFAYRSKFRFMEQRHLELAEEIEERRKVEAELKDVASRLITAQEAERRRIARELHDDLNQKLAALTIDLSRVDSELAPGDSALHAELTELEKRTAGISEDVRKLSHDLHPTTIEHVGLVAGLRSLCHDLDAEKGIDVDVDLAEVSRKIESPTRDAVLGLYRITQEALRNIRTHSGASNVRVVLAEEGEDPRTLRLTISDDGVGFDPSQPESKKGLGLVSMAERARLLDGTFDIESSSGSGTELKIRIPLDRQKPSFQ